MFFMEIAVGSGLEFFLPWIVPVVLLVLLIVFRIRLAELVAEAVHVFRSRLGILRVGAPLGSAQGLTLSIRHFCVDYEIYMLCPSGNIAALHELMRHLLQIRQQIVHALEVMPGDFSDRLSRSVGEIDQLKNLVSSFAGSAQEAGKMPEELLAALSQTQDVLCQNLLVQLEKYCSGTFF